MNGERFIAAVRAYVRDAAIEDVLETIQEPVGRRIPEQSKKISEWLQTLTIDQKTHIHKIVELAVDNALFGLFVVLDGDRVIDATSSPEARFELTHIDQERRILNPVDDIGLHDLYNSF